VAIALEKKFAFTVGGDPWVVPRSFSFFAAFLGRFVVGENYSKRRDGRVRIVVRISLWCGSLRLLAVAADLRHAVLEAVVIIGIIHHLLGGEKQRTELRKRDQDGFLRPDGPTALVGTYIDPARKGKKRSKRNTG